MPLYQGGKCLKTKRSGRNILSSFDRLSEAFFHGENLLNKFLFFKSGNQDMEWKLGFSNLGICNVCGGKLLPIQIVIYHEPPALWYDQNPHHHLVSHFWFWSKAQSFFLFFFWAKVAVTPICSPYYSSSPFYDLLSFFVPKLSSQQFGQIHLEI